jgi:hypothetical protein
MEKLAKATGANIVSKVSELSAEDVGHAGMVEERKIWEDSLTFVTGAKNAKAVSILIRGGTEHVIDEIERSLDDALNVVAVAVEDGRYVFGGGATAEELAMRLRDHAAKIGGREQIAFESFSEALETIPRTLAENAGLDPIDMLIELRKAHKSGQQRAGVNLTTGKISDMGELHVIEPIRVGMVALVSALLVLIASYDGDYLMARGPLKKLLLGVGARSYTLYLVHIPAFFATREIWWRIAGPHPRHDAAYTIPYCLTAAALLIGLAELNYRLVETPLRLRGARIARGLALRMAERPADALDPKLA